jgi:hypothetical protein
MKFTKQSMSFGQNIRDVPAPGANVAPLPAAIGGAPFDRNAKRQRI